MDFGAFKIPVEHIVYMSSHSFVFVNLRPFLPYHLLVVPFRKAARISELSDEEWADLNCTAKLVVERLKDICDGFNVITQDGQAAGQTVYHVHIHVVPRKKGDLMNNNDVYKETNLDVSRPNRTFEEMAKEAEYLRKLFSQDNK